MNRRIACLALLAFAPATFAAEPAKQSGAEKLGWKLTLQSWTMNFLDHSKDTARPKDAPKSTLFESLEIAQKLGLKYIEVYSDQLIGTEDKAKFGPKMTDEQLATVLAKAKNCGVTIIDCGVINIPSKEEDARKLFDWAKKVGITTLVSEPDPNAIPMIDKLAGEYKIQVAIHEHKKPNKYWDPAYVNGLVSNLKNVGFCADVGHWKRSGLDPVVVLDTYGEKVFSLHFKDLVPNADGKEMHDVIWGTGESKAAAMLKTLKAKGFKGPIAIEYETKWDLPMLQKCVDFFNAEADKLAGQ